MAAPGRGMSPSPLLDAALAYAGLGWPVFPQVPRGKEPLKGSHGVHDATTDPDQIRAWWRREPRANIGLAAGPAFWVLDVDTADGKGGEASLSRLVEEFGPLPYTVTAISGSGGWHFYFQPAPELNNRPTGLPGLDVRTTGCAITAPPSIHRNGRPYRWAKGRGPGETPIVPAPRWLLWGLAPPPSPPPPPPPRPIKLGRHGWAADKRLLAYGVGAVERACQEIEHAPFGTQCNTLEHRAYGIGQLVGGGVIPKEDALALLVAAGCAMASQPGKRPWTQVEVRKRVEKALRAGMAMPRQPQDRGRRA
jgi:hypothetical protein